MIANGNIETFLHYIDETVRYIKLQVQSWKRLYEQMEADPAVIFAHAIERQDHATTAGGFEGEISLEDALEMLEEPTEA